MRASTRRMTALLAAGFMTVGLAACSDSGESGGTPAAETTAPTSAATSEASAPAGDVEFVQMMIPHHEQAIEMADMALARDSLSPQVRELATQIKAAQDPEIKTMLGWLNVWGAQVPTGDPTDAGHGHGHGGGMMSAEDMQALGAAQGAEFERMWLTMMIEHHEGAVTSSEEVLKTTQNPDVEEMARSIVESQQSEIATMQGLLGTSAT